MTLGDLIGLVLLATVLVGFWLMGRHWSKVPPALKPPRRPGNGDWRRRVRWFAIWWALLLSV